MNTAVDFIRSRKNETELEAAGETGKEDTYRDFDTLEALKVLDERERTVVVLRFSKIRSWRTSPGLCVRIQIR